MYDKQRVGVVRTLSVFFIVWSMFGPIDRHFIEFKSIFFESAGIANVVLNSVEVFWTLKTLLVVTSVVLMKWPSNLILSGFQLILGSLFLYLGVISISIWNYNTHIVIISILTFVSGLRVRDENNQKDLVTALSLVFATIYYQAAISKIVVSGLDWMNTGLSIYIHMLKFNPTLSLVLNGDPILFRMAGWLTVVGELLLATMFLFPSSRKLAAIISIAFHIMLWLTFHISFWHLWIFYPAVYLKPSILSRSNLVDRNFVFAAADIPTR